MSKLDLMRKGQVATLKEELVALETRIRRYSEELVYHGSDAMGIDKIDADAMLQAAQDLHQAMSERTAILAAIAELEG